MEGGERCFYYDSLQGCFKSMLLFPNLLCHPGLLLHRVSQFSDIIPLNAPFQIPSFICAFSTCAKKSLLQSPFPEFHPLQNHPLELLSLTPTHGGLNFLSYFLPNYSPLTSQGESRLSRLPF